MPTERADILIAGHATLSTPGDDDALAGAIFAPARRALPVWEDVLERPVRYGAVDDARLPAPEELLAAVPGLRSEEAAARGIRLGIDRVDAAADDLAGAGKHVCRLHGWPTHSVDEFKRMVGNGIPKLVERFAPEGTGAPVLEQALGEVMAS